jgi:hypothetical protein
LAGAATSSFRTGARDRIGRARGFRADCSAEGAESETDRSAGLPFRREERLGRPARVRDLLTIVTAKVVLLLPVVEQESPRLFGYSRHRSGIRQHWQVVTADAGCPDQVYVSAK